MSAAARSPLAMLGMFVLASAAACNLPALQSAVPDASDAAPGDDGAIADTTVDARDHVVDAPGDGPVDGGLESPDSPKCASTDLVCDGGCVAAGDIHSCGSCANDCARSPSLSGALLGCSAGKCSYVCPANRVTCGSDCVDVLADKRHCGSCTRTCPIACVAGTCAGTLALAAGWEHTCALLPGGAVDCWGSDVYGQLGNGMDLVATPPPDPTPMAVPTIVDASSVVAGEAYTCALRSPGTVECWGYNGAGQLGNGTGTNSSTPVAVSNLAGVSAISAGYGHACAILPGGAVRCWGSNVAGELGDGTTNTAYAPVAVPNLVGAVSLAVGFQHTCAVLSDGTVKCWGDNTQGQLGTGGMVFNSPLPAAVSGLSGVTALAAGRQFTCALLSNATVRCWGDNTYGQLGDGTATNSPVPVVASGVSGVTGLVAGWGHTCALRQDGSVRCWGYNGEGQLGDGTTLTSLNPVVVANLSQAIGLAAGEFHTCARRSDAVLCWGTNHWAQLGNGTTTSSSSAVAVVW